jgi:signal transduction histidine kinase
MSSKTGEPVLRSAAWRISLWATLAFACGTILVFVFLQRFMGDDIQRRTDAWLSGEIEVLGDVAFHTPKDTLYSRVVGEVAELASREVPNRVQPGYDNSNDSVFFLQTAPDGSMKLWVGAGDGQTSLAAIRRGAIVPDKPSDLRVEGHLIPFRVATLRMSDGSSIYLGVSERDEMRVLRSLRERFLMLGLLIVFFDFLIVFYITRRMLGHVREITEAASRIGESDLSRRVPTTPRNDEVGHLARTLNHMLDRIESSVHQLHTITDALAHDLRSPLTAIRGKLEVSLSTMPRGEQVEPIVCAIDELDRLSEFLNKSLDVAEAEANALRLTRSQIDLDGLLRVMIDLYEPGMSERGIKILLRSAGTLDISADSALVHRMVANLFDNELKHLPASCTVTIRLFATEDFANLIVEDDGPGFASEIGAQMFERRVKGRNSNGRGLGLAFVEAVVRTHGGTVTASNRSEGGARLSIRLPLSPPSFGDPIHFTAGAAD